MRGNIIPNEVMLSGTIRTFEPKVLERILRRVDEIVAGVTQAWRRSTSSTTSTLPAVVNDVGAAACSTRCRRFVGAEHIGPARATGADDMSYFLERAPGAYILLGAAATQRRACAPAPPSRVRLRRGRTLARDGTRTSIIEAATGSTLS